MWQKLRCVTVTTKMILPDTYVHTDKPKYYDQLPNVTFVLFMLFKQISKDALWYLAPKHLSPVNCEVELPLIGLVAPAHSKDAQSDLYYIWGI